MNTRLNYFNYFTEIEDVFIRRRGKHLLLSPMDWALIESWKEIKVPLHVALRGIEKSFDSWESKPRKRSVKSLLYCQEEVEAQFAEWQESRIGAAEPREEARNGASSKTEEGLPFARTAILGHLKRSRSSLQSLHVSRSKTNQDELSEAIARAITLLDELKEEFEQSAAPNAQKLEQSLSGVERMLSDALRLVVNSEQLEDIEKEVNQQLKAYRKHMDASIYQQTFDNLLLKRLREKFGIPRLSLFYL